MKSKIAAMVMAIAGMSATAPAFAASADIEKLATYTGLSERKVQMILGTRTAFAEYPYTYERSLAKFKKALGKDNYERLMSGQRIRLDNGVEVRVARVDER